MILSLYNDKDNAAILCPLMFVFHYLMHIITSHLAIPRQLSKPNYSKKMHDYMIYVFYIQCVDPYTAAMTANRLQQ